MYPTLIDFGPIGIHSYGLMLATAFITAVFVIQHDLKRRGFVPDVAATIVVGAAIGGIVGAKIYAALLDGRITLTELFSTTGWSGTAASSAAASESSSSSSVHRTLHSPQSILSGPFSCSATASDGSAVSSLGMATMDHPPISPGRWRFQTEPSRQMNVYIRHRSMRRSHPSHFSGSSGRSAAHWKTCPGSCSGRASFC